MRKFLFSLAIVGLAQAVEVLPSSSIPIYSNNQVVKPVNVVNVSNAQDVGYWNAFFKPIQSCIQEAYKTELEHLNVPKKEYIPALGLGSGYYVLVNTRDYTLSDVCYVKYELQRKGYKPIYEEPIDTLIVGIFQRKPDAESIAQKLKAMKIDTEIKYIESHQPQTSYASQPSPQPNDAFSKQKFTKIINTINDQFKNQNVINQQLYKEIQELRQEVVQLKEQKQKEGGNYEKAQ